MYHKGYLRLYFESENLNLCFSCFWNLVLLVYWLHALAVALGPGGAFHWSTWWPLIRQHFSSVIALELMSFQWVTATTATCVFVRVCVGRSSFSSHFSLFLRAAAFELAACEWGERAELDQLSSGFPKAALIHLIIFQEVIFFGLGGLSHISCWRTVIVWWLRCSEAVGQSRPRFSWASWIPGAGAWSLLFWQHFRLYLSLCRCVTVCTPDLQKVRGEEEVKTPDLLRFSCHITDPCAKVANILFLNRFIIDCTFSQS